MKSRKGTHEWDEGFGGCSFTLPSVNTLLRIISCLISAAEASQSAGSSLSPPGVRIAIGRFRGVYWGQSCRPFPRGWENVGSVLRTWLPASLSVACNLLFSVVSLVIITVIAVVIVDSAFVDVYF